MNRSFTIYLIDKDSSVRKGLSNFLSAAGHHVEAFSASEDFFQIQPNHSNSCLVMDVWDSDKSGEELHTIFAHKHINIPIIFLSALDDEKSFEKAHAAHGTAFFRKPIDGPALLDTISWAIETGKTRVSPPMK